MNDRLNESLTLATAKAGGGGILLWAWLETNMNIIIGLLTILYFLCQLIVIWPKTWAEIKRHGRTVKGWFAGDKH